MAEVMNRANDDLGRKHRRSFEDEDDFMIHNQFGKRVRLDSVFEDLTLTDKRSKTQPTVEVNTDFDLFEAYSEHKDINAYIADKILEDYTLRFNCNNKIIRPYSPTTLIAYHFQQWILRLFNRFITKYNRNNTTKVPRFKHFLKLINVIELNQYQLTYHDLLGIVLRESELEVSSIAKRFSKPKTSLEEIEEELFSFNDIKYNYWDTIQSLEKDIEMLDEEDDEVIVPDYMQVG